jgi:predicted phosphoribosyltransferase
MLEGRSMAMEMPRPVRFRDRFAAGRYLADRLSEYRGLEDAIVLALPRGGVEVGYEVARALGVPMDVFVVRKLGVPGHTELALGAIASGGVRVINREVMDLVDVTPEQLDEITALEQTELERRERAYRGARPAPDLRDHTVILVDDGLATGATMQAAVEAVRRLDPAKVVVAVPVASADVCRQLRTVADEVVCAATPEPFFAVGAWYDEFEQLSDSDVTGLLAKVPVAT